MADIVKIMCMGDSITWGDQGGYRGFLAKMLNEAGVSAEFVGAQTNGGNHEGYPGFAINDLIVGKHSDDWGTSSEISVTLNKYAPDILLLMVGTNNLYFADPAVACAEIKSLIDKCLSIRPAMSMLVASILPVEPGPKPWGATIPEDVRERVPEFNRLVQEAVMARKSAGKSIDFVDQYPVVQSRDDVGADGVHPQYPLYEKIALRWFDGLTAFLPITR